MQYMIRIEMNGATAEMYTRLHLRAAVESLDRFLTNSATLQRSHAPTGTYWTEAYSSEWDVLEAAKRAVLPIDAKAEIVVSGGPQLVYYHCKPVVEMPPPRRVPTFLAAPPTPKPASSLEALYGLMATPVPNSVAAMLSAGVFSKR